MILVLGDFSLVSLGTVDFMKGIRKRGANEKQVKEEKKVLAKVFEISKYRRG